MPADLIRRQKALQKTADKYRGKRFEWNKADCLAMLRSHLVAAGHKGLPKLPKYKDGSGAVRAFKKEGFKSLEELLDSILPRITPAEMLPADVALMKGDGPLDAVTISAGRKMLGWHADSEEAVFIVAHEIKAAWRV
jgi:hypothetical protein